VIPKFVDEIRDVKYILGGIPFGNLAYLTDGTFKSDNPDLYYGVRPEQLNRRVREDLNSNIIPST
jgi:hypothetical protein